MVDCAFDPVGRDGRGSKYSGPVDPNHPAHQAYDVSHRNARYDDFTGDDLNMGDYIGLIALTLLGAFVAGIYAVFWALR